MTDPNFESRRELEQEELRRRVRGVLDELRDAPDDDVRVTILLNFAGDVRSDMLDEIIRRLRKA